MFVFNTTFLVVDTAILSWKDWMRKNYMPTFTDVIPHSTVELFQVMTVVEPGATNFSCQIRCRTADELAMVTKFSSDLVDKLKPVLGENCLSFSTVLKESKLI